MPYLSKLTKRLAMSALVVATGVGCTELAGDLSTAPALKQEGSADLQRSWRTRVARTVVTPEAASLELGASMTLTALAYNSRDSLLSGRAVSWSSRSPSVAIVDATGRVTAQAAGLAWIRGTVENRSDSTLVTVTASPTLPASDPAQVTDLRVTATTSSSVTIAFTEVSDGSGQPANYGLLVGSPTVAFTGDLSTAVELVGTQVGATRSYTIGGRSPGTTYQVVVVSLRGRLGASPAMGAPSATVSASTAAAAGGGALPFFADGFEAGAKTNANGFTWGAVENVDVSTANPYSGNYSLRFRFGPDAPGEDSWSEQRFNMGRYLSEYWVDYMLYVPSNFVHRAESPNNNKFFMTWRDTYSDVSGGTWRIGYEYQSTASTIRPMSSRWDYNSWESSGLNHPQMNAPFIGGTGPIKPGQWTRVRMQFRAASSRTASDGVMRMWINDMLFAQKTDGKFHNYYSTPSDASLRNGYFLGWSNSGFTAETIFYIDDVKFYSINPGW
jgi:hypothetical protein